MQNDKRCEVYPLIEGGAALYTAQVTLDQLLLLPLLAVLFGSGSVTCRSEAAQPSLPNIVFILSDDQRNDALGCAGNAVAQTPTIDRLAAEGARFENAFVTSPICAASRASILTGLYERTHGFTFRRPPVSKADGLASYPAVLKRAGYRSGYVGKSHAEFEDESVLFSQMFDWYRAVSSEKYLVAGPDGSVRHETELCGDLAVEFLESNPDGQPFVLSVSFFAAHAVDSDHRLGHHYEPLPSLKALYVDAPMPAPRWTSAEDQQASPHFLREGLNRERWFWRWDTPEKYDSNQRDYWRVVTGIDLTVSRILDTLAAEGLAENTIVVYSSDNGYMMGDRGMAGKWNHYDQSLRVPLIVFDPRQPPERRGQTRRELVLNVDLAPTFLDYAGLPPEPRYQGVSLRGLIEGAAGEGWRDEFYCEHLMRHPKIPHWKGVRSQNFKYAIYPDEGEGGYECLYDLRNDPAELENLASASEFAALLSEMRRRLQALMDGIEPRFDDDEFVAERASATEANE